MELVDIGVNLGHRSFAADRDAVATRRPGTLPAIVVKDGPKQPVNVFLGTATRIVLEATIEGEMPGSAPPKMAMAPTSSPSLSMGTSRCVRAPAASTSATKRGSRSK